MPTNVTDKDASAERRLYDLLTLEKSLEKVGTQISTLKTEIRKKERVELDRKKRFLTKLARAIKPRSRICEVLSSQDTGYEDSQTFKISEDAEPTEDWDEIVRHAVKEKCDFIIEQIEFVSPVNTVDRTEFELYEIRDGEDILLEPKKSLKKLAKHFMNVDDWD